MIIKSFNIAAAGLIAVGILYAATPLIPTSWIIHAKDAQVEDGVLSFRRDVIFGIDGYYSTQVMRDNEILPQCGATGQTFFEERGSLPVEWRIPCDMPDGNYSSRTCLQAVGVFGMLFKASCINAFWTIGGNLADRVEEQNMLLMEQRVIIEELSRSIKK